MTQSAIVQTGSVRHIAACFAMALLAVCLAPGCVAPGPRGELPIGCWSGQGAFVYETWPGSATTKPFDSSATAQSVHREYKTTLCIQPGRIEGRDAIMLDILSARGGLPGTKDLGDETHIKAALVKAKRLSDSTVLYRFLALRYNPKSDEELQVDEAASPVGATCTTVGDRTFLQVQYMRDFFDVFRFEGAQVEKTGVLFNPDSGMITWVESLSKSRTVSGAPCCQSVSPVARRSNE
jgi:hypothetical protein